MSGTNTRDNTVAGNWIGIGMKGNVYSNAVGVSIRDGAGENVIGSTLRGNLISGNTQGISLYNSNDNQVIGNLIGLGTDGQTPVANQNGGILLFGGASGNQIGGSAAGERNTIAANGGQGIYISGTGSDSNSILGNYIGVAADGSTPRGNLRQGILVAYDAHETLIGGSATGQGNVIAYNGLGGVRLDSDQNTVVGNLIGVAADGITPLGNQFNGIRVGGNENVIGPGNLIANNQIAGVVITGNQVTVQGNRLVANATAGMCVTGTHTQLIANEITANGANGPLSDECVIRAGLVMTGTQTLVQGNTILDNQAPGIVVSQGIRNRLVANSISNNQISGIALRDGGNVALAAPTITAASQTQIDGIGCANCTIEVFGDDGDQGRDLLGTTTADPQGQFHLTLARVSFRKYATATNTDANGNTSPFAQPVPLPISLFLPLVVTQ
jgi:parallel beta-helix repeat protein